MSGAPNWPEDDAVRIRRALATEGGHLCIGLNGYRLYYAEGSTLSGYDIARMKADCLGECSATELKQRASGRTGR